MDNLKLSPNKIKKKLFKVIDKDISKRFMKYNGKYLKGYSKRPVKRYNKLNNAMKNAIKNSKTKGITMSKKIKKYTLRKGDNLLNSPTGEISWVKLNSPNKSVNIPSKSVNSPSKSVNSPSKSVNSPNKSVNSPKTIIFNSKTKENFLLSNFYGGSEICYMKDRFINPEIKELFDDFENCDSAKFIFYLKKLQPNKTWTKAKLEYWFKDINGKKEPIRGILAKLVGTSVKDTPTGKKRLKIIKDLVHIEGDIIIKKNLSAKEKKELMYDCLKTKFSKEKYKKILLNTGTSILHEKPMRGKGDDWTYPGNNWLGELLMKVREELR